MTTGQEHSDLAVIWHDLECGGYDADLGTWRALADRHGGPILDVGAGTGRTALDLARRGYEITALDHDPLLIAALIQRAGQLPITAVVADARQFELDQRFPLIIVPMQTIQLLGPTGDRQRFLACAAHHIRRGGVVAVAITEALERFSLDDGFAPPTPDMREIAGVVYSSQPTAVRENREGFTLERMRERIGVDGHRSSKEDVVHLGRLTAAELEREAQTVGLRPQGRDLIAPTGDHVGSVVVRLGG